MTCANCGAKIEKDALICPYCGYENELVAKKEHDKVLKEYKKKTSDLKNLPEKVVTSASRYMLIAAGVIIALFVAGLLISFVFSKLYGDNSLKIQHKHLMKLEEYQEDGKYDEMWSYLDDKGLYGATYEKYWRISWLYDNVDWRIEALKDEQEFICLIELTPEEVATAMSYSFEELVRIAKMESEGFIYGEKAEVLEVKNMYVEALKEYMKLTEEEIELGIAEYGNAEVHNDLAQRVIIRVKADSTAK